MRYTTQLDADGLFRESESGNWPLGTDTDAGGEAWNQPLNTMSIGWVYG